MFPHRHTTGILEKGNVPGTGYTYREGVMPPESFTRQNPVWHEPAQYGRVTLA